MYAFVCVLGYKAQRITLQCGTVRGGLREVWVCGLRGLRGRPGLREVVCVGWLRGYAGAQVRRVLLCELRVSCV